MLLEEKQSYPAKCSGGVAGLVASLFLPHNAERSRQWRVTHCGCCGIVPTSAISELGTYQLLYWEVSGVLLSSIASPSDVIVSVETRSEAPDPSVAVLVSTEVASAPPSMREV